MALNFQLRRPQHAIAEFTATVNFARPVSAPLFAQITQVLGGLAERHNLPAPVNLQVFQFNMESGGAVRTQSSGVGFQRFAPSGEIDSAITLDPASISIQSNVYPGWAQVMPFLLEIFTELGSHYIREIPLIRSIGLNYINEFRGITPSVEDTRELFQDNTRWLAPFRLDTKDIWHCHTGQF